MPIAQTILNHRVPIKIWTNEIDTQSKEQLWNIANIGKVKPKLLCLRLNVRGRAFGSE